MQIEVEIPTVDVVLADQLRFVGLIDRGLQILALADEFAANVDVTNARAHREGGDEETLAKGLRIVPHDVAVLAGAGLGLIGVDDKIMRPLLHFLRHEGPFEAGRKSSAAASTQARLLDDVDDRLGTFFDDRLGAVPGAAVLRRLEAPVLEAIKICEDAVSVGQHQRASVKVVGPPTGSEV